ncbi:MAG: flagellar protein FlaG [Paenibacillus sp.]|nr:flagellar protein FlaG [Paenibacillus sp.]
MDVRFSSPKIYNNQLLDRDALPVNKTAEVDNYKLETISNSSELNQLERQGVKFSMGEEQVIKALDRALHALQGPHTMFEVSMHKETHTIMVKVLNKETGELIREVPPEKTLDLVANMMEIAGIIIDERV